MYMACGTYRGQERGIGCWWGDLVERAPLGGRRRRWGILLKWIFRKWDGEAMDRIAVARNKDRWQAVVNAAMKLRVP
jgi:hypothetical protein